MSIFDDLHYISPGRVFPHFNTLLSPLHLIVKNRLWLQVVIAMVLGVATGLLLSPEGTGWLEDETAAITAEWLALPGTVFLSLIQMIVIPLIICSIVLGVSSGQGTSTLRKVGLRVVPYFVVTTFIATIIGAAVATLIRPGDFVDSALVKQVMATSGAAEAEVTGAGKALLQDEPIPRKIASIFPTNPLQAALDQQMLQVVIFAVLIGIALASIPEERAKPLKNLFTSLMEVSMKVVSWAMMIAPFAVFGLLAKLTIQIGLDVLLGMGVYVGTVLFGLLCLLGVYLLIVFVFGRRNPFTFLGKIKEVQLLAFSTSSSAAVMPVSMKTAVEKLNVKPGIVRFLVPLGATINMDGTALYQVVAAIFLTQIFAIDLTTGSMVLLMLTTIGASIGAPSTPGVGIVILATILEGVGVPAAGIALIIGVDRILDMSRTAVNVTGDLVACTVMHRWIGEELHMEQAELRREAAEAEDSQASN